MQGRAGCLRPSGPPPGQLRAAYAHRVLGHGIQTARMVAPLGLPVLLVVCSRGSAWRLPPFPAVSGWPALPPTALAQQPAPVTSTRVGVGSRVKPHGVGAGVTATGADGQSVQVVRPAGLVGRDLAGGKVTVGEAD
jgi:hypothetical protein